MSISAVQCECFDRQCPEHPKAVCLNVRHNVSPSEDYVVRFRVDMDDQTGTTFCPPCDADAMESGLFV